MCVKYRFQNKKKLSLSRVPQESCLGPLLFISFIDIFQCLILNVLCTRMIWSYTLKLFTLRHVVTFTQRIRYLNNNNYSITDFYLTRVTKIRDLDMPITSSLSFTEHVNKLTVECSKSFGFVMRNLRYHPSIVLRIAYFTNYFSSIYLTSNPDFIDVWWNKISFELPKN